MASLSRRLEGLRSVRASDFGPRIRRLSTLVRGGLPVAPAHALSRVAADRFYASCLPEELRPGALLGAESSLERASRVGRARALLAEAELSSALRRQLRAIWSELGSEAALVVRPSLVSDIAALPVELHASQVRVGSLVSLERAVLCAYRALFDSATFASLALEGAREVSVSVLVQRMVEPGVSAVVYTRNPLTGEGSELLVQLASGLCGDLVGGHLPMQRLRVDRATAWVREAVRVPAGLIAGTQRPHSKVETLDAAAPQELGAESLAELVRLSVKAERRLGAAAELHWVCERGAWQMVGARVLFGALPRGRSDRTAAGHWARSVWSNQEVSEAFGGVLTPMTWSLLGPYARDGLRRALAGLGCRMPRRGPPLVAQGGRPYLNMSALVATVCELPGVAPESLAHLGLDGGEGAPVVEEAGTRRWRLPLQLRRLLETHRFAELRLQRRAARLEQELDRFSTLDPRLLSPVALDRSLSDAEVQLGRCADALLECHGIWLAHLLGFRSLLQRYHPVEAEALERDLCWELADLELDGSASGLLACARALADDPVVLAWARAGGDPSAASGGVREACKAYLRRHGASGFHALDPAAPRWEALSGVLVHTIAVAVSGQASQPLALDRVRVARGRRERAERVWSRAVPLALRPVAAHMRTRLKRYTALRTRLLEAAVRSVAALHGIHADASRRLQTRHPDAGPDGACFLTMQELHRVLREERWDVSAQLSARRTQWRIESTRGELPGRFCGAPPASRCPEGALAGDRLQGLSGSAGSETGTVRHVRCPEDLQRVCSGDVLLVPAIDFGLAPVLACVSAVISERGGTLSQGVMLASALGVPCVVGVDDVLRRLPAGSEVRVDADRREVCVRRVGPRCTLRTAEPVREEALGAS